MWVLATTRWFPHKTQNYVNVIYGKSRFRHCRRVNIPVNTNELIEQGNQHRANREPEKALQCYAMAFVQDPNSAAAWNNYGNVMREIGHPARAVPFLEHAAVLDPNNITARFNLAVTYLLMGDYGRGWPAYESRWNYEHLAGTEPKFAQPRWRGEDIRDKTVLVVGEQGHGDCIQFVRFVYNLHLMGARIKLQVTDGLIPLLSNSDIIEQVAGYDTDMGEFDYWVPIMSIPGILGVTLENLPSVQSYLNPDPVRQQQWLVTLGPKKRMRVGISWSGRRDSWLNQHKGIPFPVILDMIKNNPQYEWINLQADATEDESAALADAGVTLFPGAIHNFADTAALMMHLDVVIGVDTAVSHLAGALGRPAWIMLNQFAVDWRWLLNRDSSPWYATARLFRQPQRDDWQSVTKKVSQFLSWFKV
jgi:tetratricopeptide (TPR) repeat protein